MEHLNSYLDPTKISWRENMCLKFNLDHSNLTSKVWITPVKEGVKTPSKQMKTEIKQRSMSLVLGNGMAKSPLSMVRRHKWKTKKIYAMVSFTMKCSYFWNSMALPVQRNKSSSERLHQFGIVRWSNVKILIKNTVFFVNMPISQLNVVRLSTQVNKTKDVVTFSHTYTICWRSIEMIKSKAALPL